MRSVLIVFLVMWAFAGVSLAADTSGGSPADAHFIVSKIIAAYGGKEAIEGIKSVYAEGTIEAFMRRDRGTYQLSFKRPRKLRVDTKYEHSSETRILDGDRGYRAMDGLPLSEARGGSLLAMIYQYKHFDLPYGLLKGSYSITLKGQEALNGKKVEVLHLTDNEGPPMDAYVDTGTFHIVKVTGYFEMGGGRSTALSAEFSDFRKVGETVFPFRLTNYAGGYKIAQTEMKVYRINPQIPDSRFNP